MDSQRNSNQDYEFDYNDYPDGSRIVSEEMYLEEMRALEDAAMEDLKEYLKKGLLIATGIGGAIYLIKKLIGK